MSDKGFFRSGSNPGVFGKNSNGPKNQTNEECCDSFQEQLLFCEDLLQCQVIQDLMALSHNPVTLAASATLGGMSISPTQVLGMTQATAISNGWLSSVDWNTFNSKVGGSGTINFIPRWTPTGVLLGNSTIQDDGTTAAIGSVPTAAVQWLVLSALASGGINYAGYFASLGISPDVNIGLYATASGGATNIAILVDGNIQPNALGYDLGTIAAYWANIYTASAFVNTAFRYTDGNEAVDRVLRSDATGNASWVDVTTLPILTGSGTVDFIPRWTPSGTNLGDSIIQSTATRAAIGLVPVATAMFSIVNSGAAPAGLNVESVNTQRAGIFRSTSTAVITFDILQSSAVGSTTGLNVSNTSAIAASVNIGTASSTTGANAGGTNIGIDVHATGAATNYGVRSEGHIVPFTTKTFTLGVATLRYTGLFLGCFIDYNEDLIFQKETAEQLRIVSIDGTVKPGFNMQFTDAGRCYFGSASFIVKSGLSNAVSIFAATGGTGSWSFGNNDAELRASGNLGGRSLELLSSNASNFIHMANADDTKYWDAGKIALDYVIRGLLGAAVTTTDILIILQSNGNVGIRTAAPAEAFDVTGNIQTSGVFKVAGFQILASRQTGYTNAMTGIANRATSYDTSTITLQQLAERIKALQDDLAIHGLIGI